MVLPNGLGCSVGGEVPPPPHHIVKRLKKEYTNTYNYLWQKNYELLVEILKISPTAGDNHRINEELKKQTFLGEEKKRKE